MELQVLLVEDELSDMEAYRRDFPLIFQEYNVQATIHQYVNKTLELGRMPTDEDMSGGGCGHGCGCHH